MDPDKPEEFVNHFWPDIDLMPIVKNSNKYIDKKNRLKNRYSPNRRRQLRKKPKKQIAHITLTELKRFMGVVMYMATFGLTKPRDY